MPSTVVDMLVVHRVFRSEFNSMPALIAAVPAGDTARAKVVGDHVKFMVAALHHHHAAEDELVWPKLQSRAPDHHADLQRMVDEHTEIATAVDGVESLVSAWTKTADPIRIAGTLGGCTRAVDVRGSPSRGRRTQRVARHRGTPDTTGVGGSHQAGRVIHLRA
jgi:hemerythrin-like domain-containing protein